MTSKSVTLDLPSFGKKRVTTVAPTTPPTPPAPTHSPFPRTVMVATRPLPKSDANLPPLPKGKRPNFSSHRNDANAALAVDRLAEVHEVITGWHQTLRQTLLDIQDLYQAGPIIEGWLEAAAPPTAAAQTSASILRHGDPTAIAAYVDQLSQAQSATATTAATNSQYHLCRLDDEGQLHCQPCPPRAVGRDWSGDRPPPAITAIGAAKANSRRAPSKSRCQLGTGLWGIGDRE
ncbi:MAG: hypothetical protein HC812_09350 [Leptolyngbya sp. RL_3_1]|nr:hypothetical protein [Leptolyngbya sp. RL_3_1]